MNVKGFSLLSCLSVYVAVVLFTLGGIQLGETHNSGSLNGVAASGNTYTFGTVNPNNNSIDLSATATGGAGSPTSINGFNATMHCYVYVKGTGTDFMGTPDDSLWVSTTDGITQGTSIANQWNVANNPSQATAEANANASNTTEYIELGPVPPAGQRRKAKLVQIRHHHDVYSNFPPGSGDVDGDHNVGPQSDPH